MKREEYCEVRTRTVVPKIGPWMVCTRKATVFAVSRNGKRYPLCLFHAAESKKDGDPRIVKYLKR